MISFFQTLVNKLLDFTNFGRLITIFIPGLITSFCIAMFFSLLIFSSSHSVKQPVYQKVFSNNVEDSLRFAIKTLEDVQNAKTSNEAQRLFASQISSDLHRVSNNYGLLILLAIVIGLIMYEIGYKVLGLIAKMKSGKELKEDKKEIIIKEKDLIIDEQSNEEFIEEKDIVLIDQTNNGLKKKLKNKVEPLRRYDHQFDSINEPANKFKFSKKESDEVGLIYYAPFLKEKFSGEQNYFDFLVTEYYRFLEFSVIMPISIIVSVLFGISYYLSFSFRNSCFPNWAGFTILFILLIDGSLLFLYYIARDIYKSYAKATMDLILGVSDVMSKGLVKDDKTK